MRAREGRRLIVETFLRLVASNRFHCRTTQPKIFRDDTYPFTAMYDTDMNAVLNQDCSCNNQ